MKIKAYRSIKFEKIEIYETERIEAAPDVGEIDQNYINDVKNDNARTMCNFQYYNKNGDREEWIAIPWEFVISIEN